MKPISILIPYKVAADNSLYLWNQRRSCKSELANLLEFPGGKVEENECPDTACAREVLEEVGVRLKDYQLKVFKTFSFHKELGKLLIINVFIYEEEGSYFPKEGWYEAQSLLEQDIMPNNKMIINDFLSHFQAVILPEHVLRSSKTE